MFLISAGWYHLWKTPYLNLVHGWVQRLGTVRRMLGGHGWTGLKGCTIRHTKHKRGTQGKNENQEKKFADNRFSNHCSNHFVFRLWKNIIFALIYCLSHKEDLGFNLRLIFESTLFIFTTPTSFSLTNTHTDTEIHRHHLVELLLLQSIPLLPTCMKGILE